MRIDIGCGHAAPLLGMAVLLVAQPAFGQCSQYKLLLPDELRKGQSISILPFGLSEFYRRVPSESWFEEDKRKLKESFVNKLSEKLNALGMASEIRRIPSDPKPAANLTLESSLTGISDTPNGVKVTVSALIKRTSDGAEVLRITECGTTIKINVDSSFLKGSPSVTQTFLSNVAIEIAQTVATPANSTMPQLK